MAKSKYTGPGDRFELYRTAVGGVGDMELKGATMPYTSRNGHMTSFLDKDGTVAIRLDAESRDSFIETYDSRIAVQYGTEMKEFVVVPDDLLEDTPAVVEWLARSYEWAGTLKPK